MSEDKAPFGLTRKEYGNLLVAVRYGITIVIVVLITFVLVAGATRLFGYTPSSPNSAEVTPEITADQP